MSRADGINELDPRFPIQLTQPCPLFWSALRPWWAHSSTFAMAESERTGKQAAHRAEAFTLAVPPLSDEELARYRERFLEAVRTEQPKVLTDDQPAVEFVPRSRVYRELEPDTLAAEYLAAEYLAAPLDLPPWEAELLARKAAALAAPLEPLP